MGKEFGWSPKEFGTFIILAEFYCFNNKVDGRVSIILGCLFLSTSGYSIDIGVSSLNMILNGKKVGVKV